MRVIRAKTFGSRHHDNNSLNTEAVAAAAKRAKNPRYARKVFEDMRNDKSLELILRNTAERKVIGVGIVEQDVKRGRLKFIHQMRIYFESYRPRWKSTQKLAGAAAEVYRWSDHITQNIIDVKVFDRPAQGMAA